MASSLSNRARRVTKELSDIHADKASRISAAPVSAENIFHLHGEFEGPPGTPYEGGIYKINIVLPSDYPFRPPVMKFLTKVWHPNISSQTGAICLDTLSTAWSPVLTIKSALLSLQSLLAAPEPKDPQDAEVASMLMRQPEEFERVATEWAVKYAGAPRRPKAEGGSTNGQAKPPKVSDTASEAVRYGGYHRDLVDPFVNMGFSHEAVLRAFQCVGVQPDHGRYHRLPDDVVEYVTEILLDARSTQ